MINSKVIYNFILLKIIFKLELYTQVKENRYFIKLINKTVSFIRIKVEIVFVEIIINESHQKLIIFDITYIS